jgi:phage gp16-like protein
MSARDSDNRRRADLAKIHIAKKQLQLDEEIYRDLVWRVSADFRPTDPVDSAANMTSAERKALLQELGQLGYQARPPQSEDGDWIETDIPHVKKLLACAYQLIRDGAIAPTDRTQWLRKFVKRITGIDDLRWLPADECNKCIEALKAWHRRLDQRAAQKAASSGSPSPTVRKMTAQVLARISDTPDPRTGIRRFIDLLSRQEWSSPEVADAVAEIIRECGERAHTALVEWDYRRVRRELVLLMKYVSELEPSICDRLVAELGIGGKKDDDTRGANISKRGSEL